MALKRVRYCKYKCPPVYRWPLYPSTTICLQIRLLKCKWLFCLYLCPFYSHRYPCHSSESYRLTFHAISTWHGNTSLAIFYFIKCVAIFSVSLVDVCVAMLISFQYLICIQGWINNTCEALLSFVSRVHLNHSIKSFDCSPVSMVSLIAVINKIQMFTRQIAVHGDASHLICSR